MPADPTTLPPAGAIPLASPDMTSADIPARAGSGGDVDGAGDHFSKKSEIESLYDRIVELESERRLAEQGKNQPTQTVADMVGNGRKKSLKLSKGPFDDISARPEVSNLQQVAERIAEISDPKKIEARAKAISSAERKFQVLSGDRRTLTNEVDNPNVVAVLSMEPAAILGGALDAEKTQHVIDILKAKNIAEASLLAACLENPAEHTPVQIENAMTAYVTRRKADVLTELGAAKKAAAYDSADAKILADRYLDGANEKKLEELLGIDVQYTKGQRALGGLNRFVVKPVKFMGALAQTGMDGLKFKNELQKAIAGEKPEPFKVTPPTIKAFTHQRITKEPEKREDKSDGDSAYTKAVAAHDKASEDRKKKYTPAKDEDAQATVERRKSLDQLYKLV